MEFQIIENTFDQTAPNMHSLKLTNHEYDVTFSYYGNYSDDKINHTIYPEYLAAAITPKQKNISIKYVKGELYVDLNGCSLFLTTDAEILALQKRLETAREARVALLFYVQKILNGHIK